MEADRLQKIIRYYEKAGLDYQTWSNEFNMHFGYYKWKMNPLNREKMLIELNKEVIQRLKLKNIKEEHVLDMGCGLGASMIYAAKNYSNTEFLGISVVPWQVTNATDLVKKNKLQDTVHIMVGDYTNLSLQNESRDGIYAIESVCYASGEDKKDFIQEAQRILKYNGKLVIADAFLKKRKESFWGLSKFFHEKLCKNWALTEMGNLQAFKKTLEEVRLKNIEIKEISWNIAPSVIHAPFLIIKFILLHWIKNKKIKKESYQNLKGVFSAFVLGLFRRKVGYYIISAEK